MELSLSSKAWSLGRTHVGLTLRSKADAPARPRTVVYRAHASPLQVNNAGRLSQPSPSRSQRTAVMASASAAAEMPADAGAGSLAFGKGYALAGS